jgi:hypothetical protein
MKHNSTSVELQTTLQEIKKLGLNWFESRQADFGNRSHPPASYLVHILYKSRELPICNCSPIRGALISCYQLIK